MAFQLPQMLGADSSNYTPETLARRRKLAETMLGGAMGIQDIRHPLQGLAQMLQAGIGGYQMKQADERESSERERSAKMFAEILGQGTDADMAALMGASSDPWASDANQRLAALLMGEQLADRRQQTAWDREDRIRAEELARPDWQTFDAGGDIYRYDQNDPNSAPSLFFDGPEVAADQTTAVKNYEYLIGQGLDPETAREMAFGGGVNVNVGGDGQRMGAIPAGMAAVEDPSNPSGFRLEAIPGGPAALEAEAAAAAAAAAGERSDMKGNIVVQDIDRALASITDNPAFTTGIGSAVTGAIPSTPAYDVNSLIDTVKANAGFAELQQMRESSPTGGALGNVTEKEIAYLQATIGNLDPRQSPQQLQDNLKRVKNAYLDIIHGPGNGPERERLSFDGGEDAPPGGTSGSIDYNAAEPPPGWGGDPALWRFMSPEDRALW